MYKTSAVLTNAVVMINTETTRNYTLLVDAQAIR